MTRHRPRPPRAAAGTVRRGRRAVAVAVTALLLATLLAPTGPTAAAGAAAGPGVRRAPAVAAAAGGAPLLVVLDRLRPSTMPEPGGTVRVTGTVTNVSESTWRELSVYLLTSPDPLTTRAELAEAVGSDPAVEIGGRIVEPGLFQRVPDLEPGAATRFRLEVPRNALPISGEAGVYWLAVHVLGSDEAGRDTGADGRARTFLPLVPDGRADDVSTRLALGVQFRQHVVRDADGTLRFVPGWRRILGPQGRLGRTLRFAQSAQVPTGAGPTGAGGAAGWPLAWVVDPAVLDAGASVVSGNPPLALSAADEPSAAEDAGQETGDDPGDDPGQDAAPGGPDAAAAAWLQSFDATAGNVELLALPYGDLDVSAAVGVAGALVGDGLTASSAALAARGLASRAVVAPPHGLLSAAALDELGPDVLAVVSPRAAGRAPTRAPAAVPRLDGGVAALSPARSRVWGPLPGAPRSALAVRQRLLAEAALHALSDDRERPLLQLLPPGWDPGRGWQRARFFAGLDVPWLQPLSWRSLEGTTDPLDPLDPEDVRYPPAESEAEVPAYAVAASQQLTERSRAVADLLAEETDIPERLDQQALLGSSWGSRRFPRVATRRVREAGERVDDWLGRIVIRGPSFVTMSSEDGFLQVTLVNGLDRAVTVGVDARVAGGALQLTPPDPVELPARGRRSLRIEAQSSGIGVRQAALQPVSVSGMPVGETFVTTIRSSQVGLIIWVIMAGGAVALFSAIAVRLTRRLLARRRRRRSA